MEKLNFHIYHFANLGYGLPFLLAYKLIPIEVIKQLKVTVVLSTKRFKNDYGYFSRNNFALWRKRRRWQRKVRKQLKNESFNFIFSENINSPSFIENIRSGSLVICTGFDQIFSSSLLAKFESCINIHPSVLPYYRGPRPSYWCIHNGEEKSGFTIHQMTEKIDSGAILYQDSIPIDAADNEKSLDLKIANKAKNKMINYIQSYIEGKKWEVQTIENVYLNKIDYKSFPERENSMKG